MAERIADNAEHIVDEMKRRARRRLVGAIVLALAAAIVVPMLLEKEPRPLGEDVSVRIPPIDESKFVNRLTGKDGDAKPLPKADERADAAAGRAQAPAPAGATAPAAAPAPKAPVAEAEANAVAPAPRAEAKRAPANESRTDAKSAPSAPAAAAPASESKPAATPVAGAAAQTTPAGAEGFVVQLAAFADDKGANALANKLKKGGYAAYVQPVETSRGTLWRVRVGGYGSRPEADQARAKLKGEGYSGIVAPAQ
jgi:DedD protein